MTLRATDLFILFNLEGTDKIIELHKYILWYEKERFFLLFVCGMENSILVFF